MHYVLLFIAGFASACILIAVFGKRVEQAAKAEEAQFKSVAKNLEADAAKLRKKV